MNTLPDGDLRPSTRDRQRAELMAILESESGTPANRRRLVPMAAAAAIVLVVGLALVVQGLRQDASPSPAGDPTARLTPALPAGYEPLSDADKARPGDECAGAWLRSAKDVEVIEGFKATNPPRDAFAMTWVIIHGAGSWASCGYNQGGQHVQGMAFRANDGLSGSVQAESLGLGAYAKSVARITITPPGGTPVEAVLRHGFYYAALSDVEKGRIRYDSTPRPYVVRGYDASGKLIYTGPRTGTELRRFEAACYLDPTGRKIVGWSSLNPHPDPKTCRRTVAWNWLPR